MKKNIILLFVILCSIATCIAQKPVEDSLGKHHRQMMDIIIKQPKYPVKTIGIFVYNGFNTLDVIGPYQTLSELMGVNVFLVAKQKGMISNQSGLQVKVDSGINEVAHLDILLIPGGTDGTIQQTKDTTVLNWIKKLTLPVFTHAPYVQEDGYLAQQVY